MNNLTVKFRSLADNMGPQIDNKLNSAISQQRPTARRARIADHMEKEGRELQKIQSILYRLADLHAIKRVPKILQGISSKTQIADLLNPHMQLKYAKTRMAGAGITTPKQFEKAKLVLESLVGPEAQENPLEVEIRKRERDLLGRKIPGFFITPEKVADLMVELAGIQPGMTVLEPSAGIGNIAELVRSKRPDNPLDVIEWNFRLSEILELKKFNVVGTDFLETTKKYDRIVMNPPFEKLQDIDHVKHAYECLNPGGRIVAIMSPGPFFRNDKKATAFRLWFDERNTWMQNLESGTFSKEITSTGVSSKLVVIDY